jgi:hypothetical protein
VFASAVTRLGFAPQRQTKVLALHWASSDQLLILPWSLVRVHIVLAGAKLGSKPRAMAVTVGIGTTNSAPQSPTRQE